MVLDVSDSGRPLAAQDTNAGSAMGGYIATQFGGNRLKMAFDPAVVTIKDKRGNVVQTLQLHPRWKDQPLASEAGFQPV